MLKMLVKDMIEPSSFVRVSVHCILYFLWRITIEVVGLTLHRTQSRILEEDPVVHLVVLSGALRIRDLVLSIILLCKVLEDAARFKQAYLLPIRECIRYGWDSSIGIDFKEPRFFLSILADINVLDFVGLARLVSRPYFASTFVDLTRPSSSNAIDIFIPLGVPAV